mmetsp:Transcript_27602/g.44281  ORF Transcript_27602/g.44281 Transcript_27602/m.44281 type:complete len:159 (-) Transcript_27602:594-1070(-)
MSGKRIVESTLAPSFHCDNTVATAARTELETNMARQLAMKLGRHSLSGGSLASGGVISGWSDLVSSHTTPFTTWNSTEGLPARNVKLTQKMASMAAAGESVHDIETFKYNAETNPSYGYCTQEEVDGAPPDVQVARARLAFEFSRRKPQGASGADADG